MRRRTLFLCIPAILAAASLPAADRHSMAFTVSIPQPSSHRLHVMFRCEGLKGELQDFKMPAWSPGYYGIGDYARNVSKFSRGGWRRPCPSV